jgi:hypothetical protein
LAIHGNRISIFEGATTMKRFICVMGTIVLSLFFFSLINCLTVDKGSKQRESEGGTKSEKPYDEGATKGQHK